MGARKRETALQSARERDVDVEVGHSHAEEDDESFVENEDEKPVYTGEERRKSHYGLEHVSLRQDVEQFEMRKYWPHAICGCVGGVVFTFYPSMQSGSLSQASWVYAIVLVASGLIGGFMALISKNPKLWGAFVMGLTFPSVIGNVVRSSESRDPEFESDSAPVESDIPFELEGNSPTPFEQDFPAGIPEEVPQSPIEGASVWSFWPTAWAQEPQKIYSEGRAILQAAVSPVHRQNLLEFYDKYAAHSVNLRFSSPLPVDLRVTAHYLIEAAGSPATSYTSTFTLKEGATWLPIPAKFNLRAVSLEGKDFERSVMILGKESKRLVLEWQTVVSEGLRRAYGQVESKLPFYQLDC